MAKTVDYTRLRRLLKIYLVCQVFLGILLIYMAMHFQSGLLAQGRPQRFFHSVVAAFIFQVVLFYPIWKFAGKEADREIDSSATGLSDEQLKALRKRRMFSDMVKTGVFVFFVTFFYKAPKDLFILAVLFFSFILTYLSYFQCVTTRIKRGIAAKEAEQKTPASRP